MTGFITDIQRFSLHDGDGIRTTIFFHGCNMKCLWCHNPETINGRNELLFYTTKCIGCNHCLIVCPTGARGLDFSRPPCTLCGKCVDACYPQAIRRASREVSTEEIMAEIRQDALYYQYSGGGITFSGGEALLQLDFVEMLTDVCKAEGFETAIETNLLHDFEEIAPVLSKMTLIMADIKLFDRDEHKKWTGVSNDIILKNAIRLGELGVPIIFRTPLVPQVTSLKHNIESIADFIAQIPNVRCYELLNFNPLGATKYDALRKTNVFRNALPLEQKVLLDIDKWLSRFNLPILIR
ncbi:MAG: glycyl-radical enzyme activating protein [Christensenellales bacterium]|jgi:pyruvate formate lyase activating enzyme